MQFPPEPDVEQMAREGLDYGRIEIPSSSRIVGVSENGELLCEVRATRNNSGKNS